MLRRSAPTVIGTEAVSSPSVNLVLGIVSIGAFMTALDLFIVNVAFPDIQKDFSGSSLSSLSWILNAYAIVFAALLVPAGRLADRIGQKRVFIAGIALFTAASVLCALSNDTPMLVGARVIQAIGAAAVTPTSLALLLNAVPTERRSWAIGIWAAVSGMAAATGPTVGGLLVSLTWRWVFIVNVPIGIISIIVALRVLREPPVDRRSATPDFLGAGLLTLAIASLSLGIVRGPEWGWQSAEVIGAFAATVLLIAVVAYRSATHPSPIVEPAILRVPTFAISTVAMILFNVAFSIMLLGLVQFFSDLWGYSALRTGLAISPGPLAVPFVAPRGHLLVRRIGVRAVVMLGTSLFAASAAYLYLFADEQRSYLTHALPGLVLGGIGFGLTFPTLLTTASRSLPAQRFATGSAVVTMARQIGAVLGVSILIVLLSNGRDDLLGAFNDGRLVMAGASLAAGLLFQLVRTREAARTP
jgi:EmrB/QacA subfamily drug resistance transporter